MNSTALYKALIEVGASDKSATQAADDVIQVSQLPQLATKADIANLETRLLKWMIGYGFLFCRHRPRQCRRVDPGHVILCARPVEKEIRGQVSFQLES